MIYCSYTTLQSILKSSDEVDQIIISYNPEIGYEGAIEFEKNIKDVNLCLRSDCNEHWLIAIRHT